MLDTVMDFLPDFMPNQKSRHVLSTAAGMLGLLAGRKITGLAFFVKGAKGLETEWRKAHPEFEGGLVDRWNKAALHYEATHKHPVNRKLHVIGIPMIVGGAAGLLVFSPYRPMWFVSATSFSAGWILNFIGHGLYEKSAPAFADDPLSFLAGPVWDFQQLFGKKKAPKDGKVERFDADAEPDDASTVINVDPSEPATA